MCLRPASFRQVSSEPAERAIAAASKDATAPRREFLFRPPARWRPFLQSTLCDPRDEPLLYLLLNVCCTTAPAAAILFRITPSVPAPWNHILCAACLAASYAAFLQRFLLGLHYSAHRPLFRPPWAPLNALMPFVLAPLFGVPSGIYSLHHCIMHHVVRAVAPEIHSHLPLPCWPQCSSIDMLHGSSLPSPEGVVMVNVSRRVGRHHRKLLTAAAKCCGRKATSRLATCRPPSLTSATASFSSCSTGAGTASWPGWSCPCTLSERGASGAELIPRTA